MKFTADEQSQLLTLSDKMIEGAKERPQCFHALFGMPDPAEEEEREKAGAEIPDDQLGSCPLGAVYEATTGTTERPKRGTRLSLLKHRYPVLKASPPDCDDCGERKSRSLYGLIFHWSQDHQEPREQTAERLRELAA